MYIYIDIKRFVYRYKYIPRRQTYKRTTNKIASANVYSNSIFEFAIDLRSAKSKPETNIIAIVNSIQIIHNLFIMIHNALASLINYYNQGSGDR